MRAFVVRGFGEQAGVDFDWVHEQLIAPALTSVGLDGGTTGVIVEAGNIRDDVIHELVMADVVVADVSIHNANVFYELGIRHAVRNRATVLIRARIDDVPFDLKGERYLSYDRSAPAESVPRLVQMLQETLANERVDSPVFQYVPGLATGDRTALLGVPRDLTEEIGQAREEGWWGDLRLIAGEVVGLRFEEAALRAVAQACVDVGDDVGAKDAWERIRAAHPDDFQTNRALSDIYRRLGNLVASDQAIERALSGAGLTTRDRAELYALRASNSKRRWAQHWREHEQPSRTRVAIRSRELESSLQSYRRGFDEDLNHWYPGLNALALGKITIELAKRDTRSWQTRFDSDEEAEHQLRRLESEVAWLTSTVRASLATDRARSRRDGTSVPWLEISFADLRFLTSDEPDRVSAAYEAALGPALSQATVRSIRDQVEIYRDLGVFVENADATLAILPVEDAQGTALLHPVVFSGHMIDTPAREHSRFPPDKENVAGAAIREKLEEIKNATATSEDQVEVIGIAGASDGGDLLFHEACHALKIQTHVLLPVPELVYRATALSRQASRWAERYHLALRRAALVRTLARSDAMPGWLSTRREYDIWQRSNRWVLNHAWATTTTDRVTVLALWNGQVGDGAGGVADMVATGLQRGADIRTLDTVTLFGLSGAPGDEPAKRRPTSEDLVNLTGSGTTGPHPPEPVVAEQVGPLGGPVTAPSTAGADSPDQDTARDSTNRIDEEQRRGH